MDAVNFYIYNRGHKHVDWNKIYPKGRFLEFDQFNGSQKKPMSDSKKRKLYDGILLVAAIAVPIYFILKD